MGLFRLQELTLPNITISAPETMYLRLTGATPLYSLDSGTVELERGDGATFDTFFNAFPIETWKRHCSIEDLSLILIGRGRFRIRFGLHRIGRPHRWMSEHTVEFDGGRELKVDIPFWSELDEGLLYFSICALEDRAQFNGGYFATTTHPKRNVRLGIVITHYNRREQVISAVGRIKSEFIDHDGFSSKIGLFVVDNSCSINPDEVCGATLIPNRNFGGSSGFMRGLLHLEAAETFTHCLFMDDDASCELESIHRTYVLLSYAKTPDFAVAGTLLDDVSPSRLLEKGAIYDGVCRPQKKGLNICRIRDLLESERIVEQPNYGGWWLFGFALADVRSYAFPFFVRGDDILFSLMNKFHICTLNGIATWSDDFALKSGPMTCYLDMRYHLVIALTLLGKTRFETISLVRRFFRRQVFSYCYASAACISLALEHICDGPQFWLENLDTKAIRAQIAAIPSEEEMLPIAPTERRRYHRPKRRHWIDRLFRNLSLNGILLPTLLLRKETLLQPKEFAGKLREIYRYKRVCYEYRPFGIGCVVTHDKRRFWMEYIRFLRLLFRFGFSYRKLQNDYRAALPNMTSRAFWQDVFRKYPPPETRVGPLQ